MAAIGRALISVSDKTGVIELAHRLREASVEILSTGGTARVLMENGIAVTEISEYTRFPEIMGGRVKSLHPRIHGGVLARRGVDDAVMAEHGIRPIDLVAVNLYPFEATVATPECVIDQAIEQIDIGGPALLRAAAKNHAAVTVVVDPGDYSLVLEEMAANQGEVSADRRFSLAVKAFEHTAAYDTAIARYLGSQRAAHLEKFPRKYFMQYSKRQDLRYGENPHQGAAFYVEPDPQAGGVGAAKQVQGKELSFNNIADTDAAVECVAAFEEPACVIVKHANPCGVAIGDSPLNAYDRAHLTDPTSAFGGIIAFNRPLNKETASTVVERQFVEVIAAPSVEAEAAAVLSQKPQIRVLEVGERADVPKQGFDYRRVNGGLLVQDRDFGTVTREDLKVVTQRAPTETELEDLLFAWRVVKFVKSNAIVYAKGGRTVGIGAGQMSRVYSARLGALKATDEGLTVQGSVMASDAFFPFRDGVDAAAEMGIRAVIQPGGSVKDEEVIAAADERGMAMVFTGMRHFRH